MEFENVWLSIFGLVGLIFWIINFFKVFKKAEIFLPKKYIKKSNMLKKFSHLALGVIAWALIAFSLAGPRIPQGYTKNKIDVNDIFLVIDVSLSMKAEDFFPNRLEAAKKKVLEFVDLMPTDRIGIIMFSERVFTLLPLSTDLELVKRSVEEIKIGFLGSGTNIGDALALAVARGAKSLAKNKAIILLTDGVSNVGTMTPLQAAQEAKNQNTKVYTIGIGAKSNKRILKTGAGPNGYQRLPGGSIDLKTLDEIANLTGGKSFYASNPSSLKNVLKEIQKLEKTTIEQSSRVIYKEIFYKYLFAGVIILLLTDLSRKFLLKEAP